MAKFDHSEAAFFSNHVVLYEGESDEFFFRHVAKMLNSEWSFEDKNIALVEVGGKGNFSKFRRFFNSFGLKVSILSDLDVLIKDFDHLGVSEESVNLRSTLIQRLDQRVSELNIKPELSGKRVKTKVKNPRWVEKYEIAKEIIHVVMESGTATPEQINTLHELFAWEAEESRYTVISKDDEVKADLVVLIDSLRTEGIYILSKGAIEEYYPDDVTLNCSKPERALKVIETVTSLELAKALSAPLAEGRPTELEEIFHHVFESQA